MAHREQRDFYCSVIDGGRVGVLAGPYATHEEALAKVETAKALALKANAWAHFFSFGTLSLPHGTPPLNNIWGVL